MNAISYMMIEHPFASVWLALTFIAWIVIYSSTRSREPASQVRRPPATSAPA